MRIRYVILIFVPVILSGCLPFPHTSERFPAMQGRILDAATGQPISGVTIAIHDHPTTTSKTDKIGFFHFSKHRNYHLGITVGICGSDWPAGSEWSEILDISAPGFMPLQVNASDLAPPSDEPYKLKDIKLVPEPGRNGG